jgi:hypothetical protein
MVNKIAESANAANHDPSRCRPFPRGSRRAAASPGSSVRATSAALVTAVTAVLVVVVNVVLTVQLTAKREPYAWRRSVVYPLVPACMQRPIPLRKRRSTRQCETELIERKSAASRPIKS